MDGRPDVLATHDASLTRAAHAVLADWRAGLVNYRIWWRLGLLDMKLRYRRTLLGPFWVTLSFAGSAAALTLVYATLFKLSTASYFAYVISGLAVWGLMASMITQGCTTFVRNGLLIQHQPLPLSLHPLRSVVSELLVFAHNLLVVVVVLAVSGVGLGWRTLLALPALALLLINGVWVTLLLGMLCARFRDLSQVVVMLMNIAFLVTPVFWYRQMLAERTYLVDLNPLHAFLECLRAPLLGQLPEPASMWMVLVVTVTGWLLTFVVAVRVQSRIPYWL
jgi:ABC-type polysaccharide/polyol phosphate export permease